MLTHRGGLLLGLAASLAAPAPVRADHLDYAMHYDWTLAILIATVPPILFGIVMWLIHTGRWR